MQELDIRAQYTQPYSDMVALIQSKNHATNKGAAVRGAKLAPTWGLIGLTGMVFPQNQRQQYNIRVKVGKAASIFDIKRLI